MGLLDVLNGMQNGPRGPSTPSAQRDGGGMSPITMAILALLAWKGIKHFSGNQTGSAPQPAPAPGNVNAGLPGGMGGGGLSDMLKGGLGGLLAGGAAGSILSGGLGDLLNQFQQKGTWRQGGLLGQQRPQQADRPRRSRQRARRGSDRSRCPPRAACPATSCCRASASICPTSSTT